MTVTFDVDRIVKNLEKYKSDLSNLYKWKANIDGLLKLEVLTEQQANEINALSFFEKTLRLKKVVGQKLNDTVESNPYFFERICLWIIKERGGIRVGSEQIIKSLVKDFLKLDRQKFERISSTSKVGTCMFPDRYVIYDARVAYSLNWIILSENAGQQYFPIPKGRNTKIAAFDVNVLIRLKNISSYSRVDFQRLAHRRFIQNFDKGIFISEKDAYTELNKLIKIINKRLWQGDEIREQNLHFTEMLLFSIADREILLEMIKKYENP